MISASDLVVGGLYYYVQYPDAGQSKPIVTTYQYAGKTDNGKMHYFKVPGGILEGNLFLEDGQLSSLVNLDDLKRELAAKR